ncbi:MAG TPA: PBS lyase, partial [Anaeromyxobacter sp.]
RIDSPLPRTAPGGEGRTEGAQRARALPARVAVAVAVAEPPPGPPASDLDGQILAEIRAALRGCTSEGLAAALGAPPPRVDAALEALAVRGAVARRGTRWFTS